MGNLAPNMLMMNGQREKLSFQQVNDKDLVDYLASLGYGPRFIKKGFEYWYLSPLRMETKASFKVDRIKNRWFDFGLYRGGKLLDFAKAYFNCPISDLMAELRGASRLTLHQFPELARHQDLNNPVNQIKIEDVQPICTTALIDYLHERHIPLSIAGRYCSELRYQVNNRSYFAIGFQNDQGGYEIRNKFFKGSSSPKSITCLGAGCAEVKVFEGFMDFLSYQTLQCNTPFQEADFVILNGAALFEKARPYMESHQLVSLYLDWDATGDRYTQYALSLSEKYTDERKLFSTAKDLNQWLSSRHSTQIKRKPPGW